VKFKNYLVFGFLTLSSFAKSQCTDQFTETFNGSLPTLGGTWVQNALTFGSTTYPNACASCPRTGNYYLYYDAIGDYIQTPVIPNPGIFSFWYRRSSTSATHQFVVETSTDGSTWTTRGSYSGTMSATYAQFTVDLGALGLTNVYVRIRDTRPTATGAKVWYLDDISWENIKIGQWSGSVNSNWASPQNWCGNSIPTITTNVVIPAGTPNSPVLSTPHGYCKNITINSGASLKIQGGKLQIAEAITAPANSILADAGTIEMVGSTAQSISGTVFVNKTLGNLRISNSAGVSVSGVDTFKIKGILDFGVSNSIFNTNNKLTLLSSSSGTGTIADLTSNNLYSGNRIIGNATVERYLANTSKAWNFLSAPTIGQTIKQSWQEGNSALGNTRSGYGTILTSNLPNAVSNLGFDLSSAAPSIKTYNSVTNLWEGVSGTNIQIANTKGYMVFVRGDRSVTAYNQATNSTILRTYGKLYTPIDNPPPVVNVANGSFESVGNPYASDINFYKLTRTGGVQDVYYVWDPLLTNSTNSVYGLGGYQTFVGDGLGNYTITPGGGSYTSGNTNIRSGLAFFIRAAGSGGTLSFVERAKVNRRSVEQGDNGHDERRITINLSVLNSADSILLDGAFVEYGPRYSNSIDELDIAKINSTSQESVSILSSGNKLVAERKEIINNTDTIFLNINQPRRQSYILKFIPENMSSIVSKARLVDKFLGTSESLNMDSISIKSFSVTSDPASSSSDRFYIVINKSMVQNKDTSYESNNKIQEDKTSNTGICVFPNPIEGNQINLTIKDIKSGECKISILNMQGDNIYTSKIFKPGGEFKYILNPNNLISKGQYVLKVEGLGKISELKIMILK